MTVPSGFACNHPGLAAKLGAWLAESRNSFPPDWQLDVEVADQITAEPDLRPAVAVAEVDVRAGGPADGIHLTWRRAPAWATVDAERPRAFVQVSHAALAETDYLIRSLILVTVIFMWRRRGHFHVHAGTAIDASHRRWMLVGDSGSGKSTTTALLASRGWQVGTDDIAFICRGDAATAVLAFRAPIALRSGGAALMAVTGGVVSTTRGKAEFDVEELGGTWVQTIAPEIVVFTSIGGERTTLSPLSPADTLKGLINHSPWVMFEALAAEEHLELLTGLARQARGYRATLAPDLFDAPGALADFLP